MEIEREFFYDEVQDGFYIPGIMKRAWGAELTILSEIDRICNQYDIPYYADGGTLLGAVRNGQFIPWDDDIDIMMLRKDYDKFKEVLKDELATELSLYTLETQDNHYSFFATLSTHDVDVHSGLLRKYQEYPFIASVDIFVIDELSKKPEEEERRKRVLMGFLAILNRLKKNPEKNEMFQEELKKLENLISVHFDRDLPLERQLYKEIEKELIKYNGKGSERFACIPWYILHEDCSYPKTAFDKRKRIPFYTASLPVPEDYDAVLRAEYGDYHRKVRAGGAHNYPYFKKFNTMLQKHFKDRWMPEYSFSEEDLQRPEIQNFRDLAMLTVEAFYSAQTELMDAIENREFRGCLSKLATMQEEAITFGNAIEQKKGEGTKSASLIEEYCEALFELYQRISEQGARGDFSKVPALEVKALKKERKKIQTCLENLEVAVQKDFKKQVIFLPHSAKHFASLRPLIDALLEEEEVECKIIPIPYYDKCGDGRLKEIHYEGEDFPKEYEMVDYNCYDFSVELPDCIVINSPYDEFNPVWTVDSAFYSREMKKYTKKLVYIPWFVTDEINPKDKEDGKAFTNMEYYVTVPGLFHSDFTIVQSEGMKKAYLAKIEEFAGKDVVKKMEKKISGAGSCLLGDKEGQGIKEVVECVKAFAL